MAYYVDQGPVSRLTSDVEGVSLTMVKGNNWLEKGNKDSFVVLVSSSSPETYLKHMSELGIQNRQEARQEAFCISYGSCLLTQADGRFSDFCLKELPFLS